MSSAEREINREQDGKYGYGFQAVCTCGHTKSVHIAGGHECINAEIGDGADCECAKFRKARVSK